MTRRRIRRCHRGRELVYVGFDTSFSIRQDHQHYEDPRFLSICIQTGHKRIRAELES
uniref:Uncharacterized protein n=1 Tax=Hyaloperonospora arabidopsidis (strain Emoy2) TaxID=559515 RepID=M4B346_HYAAE